MHNFRLFSLFSLLSRGLCPRLAKRLRRPHSGEHDGHARQEVYEFPNKKFVFLKKLNLNFPALGSASRPSTTSRSTASAPRTPGIIAARYSSWGRRSQSRTRSRFSVSFKFSVFFAEKKYMCGSYCCSGQKKNRHKSPSLFQLSSWRMRARMRNGQKKQNAKIQKRSFSFFTDVK